MLRYKTETTSNPANCIKTTIHEFGISRRYVYTIPKYVNANKLIKMMNDAFPRKSFYTNGIEFKLISVMCVTRKFYKTPYKQVAQKLYEGTFRCVTFEVMHSYDEVYKIGLSNLYKEDKKVIEWIKSVR